jgi:hypothetical protein
MQVVAVEAQDLQLDQVELEEEAQAALEVAELLGHQIQVEAVEDVVMEAVEEMVVVVLL